VNGEQRRDAKKQMMELTQAGSRSPCKDPDQLYSILRTGFICKIFLVGLHQTGYARSMSMKRADAQHLAERENSMSSEQYKMNSQRIFEDIWNAGNLAVVQDLFAPHYVLHVP
jgi:hypothetical protein